MTQDEIIDAVREVLGVLAGLEKETSLGILEIAADIVTLDESTAAVVD